MKKKLTLVQKKIIKGGQGGLFPVVPVSSVKGISVLRKGAGKETLVLNTSDTSVLSTADMRTGVHARLAFAFKSCPPPLDPRPLRFDARKGFDAVWALMFPPNGPHDPFGLLPSLRKRSADYKRAGVKTNRFAFPTIYAWDDLARFLKLPLLNAPQIATGDVSGAEPCQDTPR
jgi:hypothetical protein